MEIEPLALISSKVRACEAKGARDATTSRRRKGAAANIEQGSEAHGLASGRRARMNTTI